MGKSYSHLNCEERTLIQLSLERNCSISEIARSLDRPTSTIIRELKRNGWKKKQAGQRGRPPIAGGYRAVAAQQQAKERSIIARKPRRLFEGSSLWNSVETLLREFKSPEQIAGILKRMCR
jgi:IS30 family transposase